MDWTTAIGVTMAVCAMAIVFWFVVALLLSWWDR